MFHLLLIFTLISLLCLGHSGPVWSVDWHPHRDLILTGSADHTARVTILSPKSSEVLEYENSKYQRELSLQLPNDLNLPPSANTTGAGVGDLNNPDTGGLGAGERTPRNRSLSSSNQPSGVSTVRGSKNTSSAGAISGVHGSPQANVIQYPPERPTSLKRVGLGSRYMASPLSDRKAAGGRNNGDVETTGRTPGRLISFE